MKKFIYVAFMALTMAFMTGCKSDGGSSAYQAGGPQPSINYENGTVNGKTYDNETEKCWKVTLSASVNKETSKETLYAWATEFEVVAEMEYMMWRIAQTQGASGSYTYSATKDTDYESCMNHNEEQD